RSKLKAEKKVGKISVSKTSLPKSKMGIGHTRWATHGGVTVANAHPHLDEEGKLALIHNGIIDNYLDLKKKIDSHTLVSETDSEIVAHLIEKELKNQKDLFKAVKKVVRLCDGFNAFVVLHQDYPYLVTAKTGSPLVIGYKLGEHLLSSDVASLLTFTDKVIFLEDNQIAKISPDSIRIESYRSTQEIKPKIQTINWKAKAAEKNGHRHFMIKEIYDQPAVLARIAADKVEEARILAKAVEKANNVYAIACGTASYAALAGQYLFSRIGKKQLNPAIGSEFYYHADFLGKKSLCIALSQSGETIDTLQSATFSKKQGAKVVSLVNVKGSSLDRLSDKTILLGAGPEKAVASTKAFLAKTAILLLTAHALKRNVPRGVIEIKQAARSIKRILNPIYQKKIKNLAKKIQNACSIFILGRGQSYPIALESALKIKEVSYIHAEGFASGELKHGVIALIQQNTPTIVFAPNDETYHDVISGAMEVKARGGFIIGISHKENPIFDY
ncbi:glutamine--fructose-6-phosphate transaminase (isomerizing), partial [Candidatus Collierbacteria bacterium]|nr:glutamine--fructose-6-phosphate transaminase (isomerizing) [Candidatus Collierbacteria bacterium]